MTGQRVLVVDDNHDMANGIAMLLSEADLGVQVAYSATGALSLMEAEAFDLVLSDIRMPTMSGVDLLQSIRSRWPLTKVVLLTAYGSIDSAVDAMKNGACDYLTKPFDNDALVDVVRRNLAVGATSASADSAAVGDVIAAISPGDLLTGLRGALDVLLRVTGADDGEIFLCEPEGGDLLLAAWAGLDAEVLVDRLRFPVGVGYPGTVAATGAPLWQRGTLSDDARYLRRSVVDVGIRSCVAVPLLGEHGAHGSLHLMSRRGDFPVEEVCGLLERVAVPISNAVCASLGQLRQSVDAACAGLDDQNGSPLRAVLESMRTMAGARHGTLALLDPHTGCPDRVVSTGPTSLICSHLEAGAWTECSSIVNAHGATSAPGRRRWPECCRRGLPLRAASPCCLPLVAQGRLYGLVVLDFGRDGREDATGRLVPLLTMAQQLAVRLRSYRPGLEMVGDGVDSPIRVEAPIAPALELHCLGPFAIIRGGQPVSAEAFTRSKALVLLKLLVLRAGTPVDREVLIEHLWPEVPPHLGANRLHGIVHDLRSVIEPQRAERDWMYVRNRGDFYYLDMRAPIDIDVTTFRGLVTQGLAAGAIDDAQAITCLERAVDVYTGDLFEDDPIAEWCEAERQELRSSYASALERLAELHIKAGRNDAAIDCLHRASRVSPFRDDLLRARMELLVGRGRSTEALIAYNDYRRLMRDEFDMEPPAALAPFYRQLLQSIRAK